MFDGWDAWGLTVTPFPLGVKSRRAVEEVMSALATQSRELAASCAGQFDVRPLLLLARKLDDAKALTEVDHEQCNVATADAEVLVEQIELRSRRKGATPVLGSGGPGKTFDAVCEAILATKSSKDRTLVAGDATTLDGIKEELDGQDKKKAADYLAPSGRLIRGGWVRRESERVVLTEQGAREWMQRLRERKGQKQ
ncbi:MAG: hypothetical protein JNL08_16975 [Planctomycetes bacterium]|nr:hypothetical protein [Planctomycetota bacterium]